MKFNMFIRPPKMAALDRNDINKMMREISRLASSLGDDYEIWMPAIIDDAPACVMLEDAWRYWGSRGMELYLPPLKGSRELGVRIPDWTDTGDSCIASHLMSQPDVPSIILILVSDYEVDSESMTWILSAEVPSFCIYVADGFHFANDSTIEKVKEASSRAVPLSEDTIESCRLIINENPITYERIASYNLIHALNDDGTVASSQDLDRFPDTEVAAYCRTMGMRLLMEQTDKYDAAMRFFFYAADRGDTFSLAALGHLCGLAGDEPRNKLESAR